MVVSTGSTTTLADTEPVEVSAVRKSPMVASMLRQAQQPQAQQPKSLASKTRSLSLSKRPYVFYKPIEAVKGKYVKKSYDGGFDASTSSATGAC